MEPDKMILEHLAIIEQLSSQLKDGIEAAVSIGGNTAIIHREHTLEILQSLAISVWACKDLIEHREERQSRGLIDVSQYAAHTAQEWFTKIIEEIDEVKMMGREPTKIIIPLPVQQAMARAFLPEPPDGDEKAKQRIINEIQSEGVRTFYGYPVEDGPEVSVKF